MLYITWLLGPLALLLVARALKLLWDAQHLRHGRLARLATASALLAWSAGGGRWAALRICCRPGPEQPARPYPSAAHYLERPDGARLFLQADGPPGAPAILFTHGDGSNSAVWSYARLRFSDRFRVITWDRRGLGQSSPPRVPDYSTETQARDLEAVLDAMSDRPVILVGDSYGGMIALTFCRLFPHHLGRRVTGLVLSDTSARSPYRHRWPSSLSALVREVESWLLTPGLRLTIQLSPLLRLVNALVYLNGSGHLAVRLLGFGNAPPPGQLDLITSYLVLNPPAIWARENLAMLAFDEQPTLGRIQIPVLVMVGSADRLTPSGMSRQLAERLPRAQFAELRPAGHLSMLEQPSAYLVAIRSFAERLLACEESPPAPGAPVRPDRTDLPIVRE